jgi:hypothetical protein
VVFEPIHGRFRGAISFEGEDGYTSVRAHRARGWVAKGKRQCLERLRGKRPVLTDLVARSGSVRFEALSFDDLGLPPFFFAIERERRAIVQIIRVALAEGTADSFTFDPDLTSAHVEPGRSPFDGSADFDAPDQWTGPLSVSFPGDPDVALAGPRFQVRLRSISFRSRGTLPRAP